MEGGITVVPEVVETAGASASSEPAVGIELTLENEFSKAVYWATDIFS